ncbi:MAG: hypothetical protein PUJ20_05700 [Bacteroidales bacterium]|nr:hypothetical protein [Bacteroidales bacterium]MDY4236297.1 hypothetical protein [Sodaliphilus sp.]
MIDSIIPFSGKEAKTVGKQHKQLNIATRNFRLSADELKKRLKVRDGGDCYLFATTLANGEQVLLFTCKAYMLGGERWVSLGWVALGAARSTRIASLELLLTSNF